MRSTLAIIIALVILVNGWLFLSGVLHGIGYLLQVDETMSHIYWINLLFMLFLNPVFGGFLSTYITPRLFEGVQANRIATGVIFVTIILTSLISIIYLVLFLQEKPDIPKISEFSMFVLQAFSLIAGAKIGEWAHGSANK